MRHGQEREGSGLIVAKGGKAKLAWWPTQPFCSHRKSGGVESASLLYSHQQRGDESTSAERKWIRRRLHSLTQWACFVEDEEGCVSLATQLDIFPQSSYLPTMRGIINWHVLRSSLVPNGILSLARSHLRKVCLILEFGIQWLVGDGPCNGPCDGPCDGGCFPPFGLYAEGSRRITYPLDLFPVLFLSGLRRMGWGFTPWIEQRREDPSWLPRDHVSNFVAI
jgi:hypothetical protein